MLEKKIGGIGNLEHALGQEGKNLGLIFRRSWRIGTETEDLPWAPTERKLESL